MNLCWFVVRWLLASILLFLSCQAAILKHKLKKEMRDPEESRGPHYSRSYRIAYGCERTMLELRCPDDVRLPSQPRRKRHISIAHATYGRANLQVCFRNTIYDKNWSFPCAAPRKHTVSVVSRRCNGKQVCRIPVVNALFGDPCPDTYKYLEVYHACDT